LLYCWHPRRWRRFAPFFFPAFLMNPLLMIPLLTAGGLAGFWLFYKSVDFFDNI
jgi:hypothetical protein